MSLELVYTSAPRGLKSTVPGFCTVAATAAMPRQMAMKLEALSGYEFCFSLSDPNVRLSPVNFAHTRLAVGGQTFSVLSRIAFAGADYSGRTNKIAHHLALAAHEEMPGGPAWMLRQLQLGDGQRQLLHADWREEARELDPRDLRALLAPRPAPAPAPARWWEQATGGDPGWAGLLLKSLREKKDAPAFVIFNPGTDLLPLFDECLALLPPAERWAVGFATYYSTLPAGCFYHWRGVLAGSSAAREVARFPNAVVIDLTKPLPRAEDSPYTRAARAGQMLPPLPQEAPSSTGVGGTGVGGTGVGGTGVPPVDAEPAWRGLIPDSLKFRTREQAPLQLRLDAADDDSAADDASRIARLERRLDAARRGHRQARTFAFAACAVAGLLLLLCIYAFVQRSQLSSDLERMKRERDDLKTELAQARQPGPERPKTSERPAPPPSEGPKTSDVVSPKVEPPKEKPPKEEPPKVAKEPDKKGDTKEPTPPPEKDKPKVVAPPKVEPLKLDPHVSIPAGVASRPPVFDDGQKVVFDTGPFQVVLMPPVPLLGSPPPLKIESDPGNPEGLLVKHRSASGVGNDRLLTCKRQGAQMVWEINKDKEPDYAACLQHLVVVADTAREGDARYAFCLRKRDTAHAKLTAIYRGDGNIVAGNAAWECRYPWVQQILVQHKDIEGGKPLPLFKAPPVTGEHMDITKKDESGRFPGIAFKGTVHAQGRPKPFEIRLVLEFTLSTESNPQKGSSVAVKLGVVGLKEYLADLDSGQADLRRLKAAGELADLSEEYAKHVKTRDSLPPNANEKERREFNHALARIRDISKQPAFSNRAETFRKYVTEVYGKDLEAKAVGNIRTAVGEELRKFGKEPDPDNWKKQIDQAVKVMDGDRQLPHELFKSLQGLTILDPWGVPLATVTPALRLAGVKDDHKPPPPPPPPPRPPKT